MNDNSYTYTELLDLINSLTLESCKQTPSLRLLKKQIDEYHEDKKFSYKDIARAVYYHYIVLGNDLNGLIKYGIGIVPFIIKDAIFYFDELHKLQEQQAQMAKEQETSVIHIQPRKRRFERIIADDE